MTRWPSILFFNKIMSCFWRVDLDEAEFLIATRNLNETMSFSRWLV